MMGKTLRAHTTVLLITVGGVARWQCSSSSDIMRMVRYCTACAGGRVPFWYYACLYTLLLPTQVGGEEAFLAH